MRFATALVILIGTVSTSFAGEGFDLVVPMRPGVPVIINGVDVSYTVVEGTFGLGKGIHMQPTIYGGRYVDAEPNVGHYYPSLGSQPGYGRMEIEPPANRKLPKPAESYHNSWGAQSLMQPAQPDLPMNPPAVIVAPPAYPR
jgi:hypothetical protein